MPAPAPERAPLVVPEAPPQERRPRLRVAVLIAAALLVAGWITWYRLVRPGPSAAPPATAAPRGFAWAPMSDVFAYAFEIRRGGGLIYGARTTRTRIRLPVRWVRLRTTFTLSRGTYQWYVWPVRQGSRLHEPAAIVAASFRVNR